MIDRPILVALPADVREAEGYFWHATPDTYLKALTRVAKASPVILPALVEEYDVDAVLDRVDGLMLTGAASNVHPDRYGIPPSRAHEPYDPDRDRLTGRLIKVALERGLPLLAICRGQQELNVAFGGTLATEIQEIEGRMDHRPHPNKEQRERYAVRHDVAIEPDGVLRSIVGAEEVCVNSLHRQAIDKLAQDLAIEARAPDGTIEAVSVRHAKGFALGVQWHPEYWAETDAASSAIFKAFGDACRTYAAERTS